MSLGRSSPLEMVLLWSVVGCGSTGTEVPAASNGLVYGGDDRIELFESDELVQSLGASVVALGLRREIVAEGQGVAVRVPSWQQRADLCENQRFADQPSFATCTGVAIGADLVLTAAHCARLAPIDELVVVTGYSYAGPDLLRLKSAGRVHAIQAVITSNSYWDYAWLRVEGGLTPLISDFRSPVDIAYGAGVFSINHGGGLPAKVDMGGHAYPLADDEFLTTLDALGGASGGPVFSSDGTLVGILSAGGEDYVPTSSGCFAVATSPDRPDAANELVVGLDAAMEAISEEAPLEPAVQMTRRERNPSAIHPRAGGCAMAGPPIVQPMGSWALLAFCVFCRRPRVRFLFADHSRAGK